MTEAAAYEAALAALSPKRAAFVREYLADLNATAAAKRVGYAEGSAHVTGSRLLSDAKVCLAIRLGIEARSVRCRITADSVVLELARLAFADLRRVARWGPAGLELVDSGELDDDAAAAVVEVGQTEHGPKLKLGPKLPALERLGRHLGMWRDEQEDRAAEAAGIVAYLEAGRERVERARAAAAELPHDDGSADE
jgi:phage terminase small subunit